MGGTVRVGYYLGWTVFLEGLVVLGGILCLGALGFAEVRGVLEGGILEVVYCGAFGLH